MVSSKITAWGAVYSRDLWATLRLYLYGLGLVTALALAIGAVYDRAVAFASVPALAVIYALASFALRRGWSLSFRTISLAVAAAACVIIFLNAPGILTSIIERRITPDTFDAASVYARSLGFVDPHLHKKVLVPGSFLFRYTRKTRSIDVDLTYRMVGIKDGVLEVTLDGHIYTPQQTFDFGEMHGKFPVVPGEPTSIRGLVNHPLIPDIAIAIVYPRAGTRLSPNDPIIVASGALRPNSQTSQQG